MSLRLRVLIALVLVLLTSAAAGGGLAGWRARQTLREELAAAMTGGRQAALARGATEASGMRSLVASFDGNRHLRAYLIDARGRILAASSPAPAGAGPAWFSALFQVAPPAQRLTAPGAAGAVVLFADWRPDVGALWAQLQALVLGLAAVLAIGAGLAWLMVGRALAPLSDFSAAFRRIGSGDYDAKVAEAGPLELVRVGRGVNEMAAHLAAMQARNQALEEQLLRLQDEERADLARDLHDEIGPHLFAVNVDAAMTQQLIGEGRATEAAPRIAAIQASVGHMQRLVRDILSRLRPARVIELGLASAIEDLAAFWRTRRPEIVFEVRMRIDEGALGETARETIYRVVQEGLSNAVRHGRPGRVEVEVALTPAGEVTTRVSDDGADAQGGPSQLGFGLVGMRERVAAAEGVLSIERGAGGWSVIAKLPARTSEEAIA